MRLERYRTRHAESAEPAAPTDIPAETEIADRVRRRQAGTSATRPEAAQTEPAAPLPASIAPHTANPAALSPSTVPHLSQVLGVDRPREASPMTAAAMPGLNRQARREIGRQARKRTDPGTPPIANPNFGRHI